MEPRSRTGVGRKGRTHSGQGRIVVVQERFSCLSRDYRGRLTASHSLYYCSRKKRRSRCCHGEGHWLALLTGQFPMISQTGRDPRLTVTLLRLGYGSGTEAGSSSSLTVAGADVAVAAGVFQVGWRIEIRPLVSFVRVTVGRCQDAVLSSLSLHSKR
jgi:hypothetical protein